MRKPTPREIALGLVLGKGPFDETRKAAAEREAAARQARLCPFCGREKRGWRARDLRAKCSECQRKIYRDRSRPR